MGEAKKVHNKAVKYVIRSVP